MKVKNKILVMLMAMTIGTLAASAQSARRGSTHEDSKRKTTSQQRQEVTSRTSLQKNQSSGNAVRGHKVTSRTSVSKKHNYKVPQQRQPRKVESRPTKTVQHVKTKTSTTNRNNANSNYRVANKTVHVGTTYRDPKSSDRTYSSVHISKVQHSNKHVNRNEHHYHYYPHKKVKLSVHPMTYRNHYRVAYYPSHRNITWTRSMYRSYYSLYPAYTAWHYPIGYRVQTISAFEAKFNMGEVSRVYGRVYATWHNRESDDYLLFFGGEYPHQEFTMVIPGKIARRYSWRPERYFLGQHVYATGLITSFEGKAEMVVKKKYQLDVY